MHRQLSATRYAFAALVLLVVANAALAQTQPQASAREVVEHLHAQLLDVMKHAKELGYTGRYKQLRPVVERSFDLPALARLSVHGYWKKFTADQQQQFVAAFTRLSVSTYASRFDGYSGESFRTVKASATARGNRLVSTQLIKGGGGRVSLNYVLHQTDDGRWGIINVVAEGVSDLALKRGQYTGVLKRQGVDSFLKRINKQVDALPKVPE